MMKKTLLATALLATTSTAALAEWSVSANVAATSDYVWRYTSQTLEDPAFQGGFDIAHESGFYAGVWGSNVDFNEGEVDDADLEADIYLGISGELAGGLGWDVGAIRYMYPGVTENFDWNEFYVGASYGPVSGSFNYSNDVFGSGETGIFYTVGAEHGFEGGITVHGDIGLYDFDDSLGDPDSYVGWSLGVSGEFASLGLDLSYFDTDSDGEDLFGDIADSRVVFTVSKEM
jgi:uncharacterized protein (TIGR02001 family)